MVLAIGIVVDDAIVVVEAVEQHIEQGMDVRAATVQALTEVSGPVVAIALVLSAVFVPVAFLGGIAGALYRQFAVTVAVSTLLSAFVALSLTPALCVILLKPHEHGGRRGLLSRFFAAFNRGFERMLGRYVRVVSAAIRRMAIALAVLAAFMLGATALFGHVPSTFVPPEDQGYIIGAAVLPEAASLERTMAATARLDALLANTPGVARRLVINGFNILNSSQQSNGALFVAALDPWDQRTTPDQRVEGVIARIFREGASIPEATVVPLNPPALPGLGAFGGFSLKLQDRRGGPPFALTAGADDFIAAVKKRPEIGTIRSSLNPRTPAYDLQVDREKAKKLGVPLTDVFNALQTYLGGLQVNDFNRFGRSYKVTMQADAQFRGDITAIKLFHVRSAKGPYFIEFMTYRTRGHSMSDKTSAYRSKEEEKKWSERDPLRIYSDKLIKAGVLKEADIKAMEKEIDREIETDVIKFAEDSPEPRVEDLNKYVLDDSPDARWIGPLQNT